MASPDLGARSSSSVSALSDKEDQPDSTALRTALRKVERRLLPLLTTLFLLNYIDRSNLSYTAAALKAELGVSDDSFGLAAGAFFIGYAGWQVPANILMVRFGARAWMGALAMIWAVVSASCGLMDSERQLLALRFLLGIAEAGFSPGVMMYLTMWFPVELRGMAMSRFMLGAPLSSVVAAPVSELILKKLGWRWMFVLEAAPVLLVALWLLAWLPNSPSEASWLSAAQKRALTASIGVSQLQGPRAGARQCALRTVVRVFATRRTWKLGAVQFSHCMLMYGVQMWLPSLLERCHGSPSEVALGVVVPYGVAVLSMLATQRGRKSARGMRVASAAIALGACAALVFAAAAVQWSPLAGYVGLALGVPMIYCCMPYFAAYVACDFEACQGAADDPTGVAIGIAAVSALGHFGGFAGPYVFALLSAVSESLAITALMLPAALAYALWVACFAEHPALEAPGQGLLA